MSRKRARSPSNAPSPATASSSHIYRSAPISDRQSIFVAHFSPTLSAAALQAHPDFRTATHRIAAWRKPTAQRSLLGPSARVLQSGHDDDGETFAGRRLARVLEAMGVQGAVCVARWYGGVMLGPVRFEHIEGCAREAVRAWRAATTTTTTTTTTTAAAAEADGGGAKKAKVGEEVDGRSKAELEKVLVERDGSIEVLRGLLAEKKRVVGAVEGAAAGEVKPMTPKTPTNYKAMPVQALVKLEKARDATIAFILKELDKIEDEIVKAMDDGDTLGEDSVLSTGNLTEEKRRDKEGSMIVADAPLDSLAVSKATPSADRLNDQHECS
ncbi:Impact [Macrophomina phaseolina MS6]|uniref:Impact n=1 Tax=Macrophomina phaseolina (strain MS6) TaxID=1126212 RepID=K2RS91_MACPH|nr:Impact [Macrophomina phaseolina MS6]